MTALLVVAYLGTVVLANALVQTFGPVPVGFGLVAPAGVYAAGLAFVLRDALHEVDRRTVVVAVLAGALLSLLVADGRLAGASALAFLTSEALDLVVWARLRRWSYAGALVVSNVVGIAVDSALFLWLAFGSFAFLAGQAVGKAWWTVAALAALTAARTRGLLPRHG